MEDIECPSCNHTNPNDAFVCQSCGATLVVGKLTSLGTGVLPKGFVLEMRAKNLSMGRHVANEFVIPSNLLARRQLRFAFTSYGFAVQDLEQRSRCMLDGEVMTEEQPLRDGAHLKVCVEEFVYNYIPPTGEKVTTVVDPMASHLQLMLGVISEFHASLNLQEVFDNAVDAVLRITGTRRGYAFMMEESETGNVELREVAARAAGGKALSENSSDEYTISQSMIQQVLGGNDSVIIEDAGAEQVETETIRRFKLKSVICLPLLTYNFKTGKRSVMGVLYADSLMPSGALPKHSRPTLQMLAQILTSTIVKWQSYDKMEKHFRKVERSVSTLEEELELIEQEASSLIGRAMKSNTPLTADQVTPGLSTIRDHAEAAQRLSGSLQYVRGRR